MSLDKKYQGLFPRESVEIGTIISTYPDGLAAVWEVSVLNGVFNFLDITDRIERSQAENIADQRGVEITRIESFTC